MTVFKNIKGSIGNIQGNPIVEKLYEQYKDVPFVKRIMSGDTRSIQIPGESGLSTHYMAQSDNYMFPTVMPDDSGNLKYWGDEVYDRAMKTGDYIKFPNEKMALEASKNYKTGKYWDEYVAKGKFGTGGIVGDPPITFQNPSYLNPTVASDLALHTKMSKKTGVEGYETEGWTTPSTHPGTEELPEGRSYIYYQRTPADNAFKQLLWSNRFLPIPKTYDNINYDRPAMKYIDDLMQQFTYGSVPPFTKTYKYGGPVPKKVINVEGGEKLIDSQGNVIQNYPKGIIPPHPQGKDNITPEGNVVVPTTDQNGQPLVVIPKKEEGNVNSKEKNKKLYKKYRFGKSDDKKQEGGSIGDPPIWLNKMPGLPGIGTETTQSQVPSSVITAPKTYTAALQKDIDIYNAEQAKIAQKKKELEEYYAQPGMTKGVRGSQDIQGMAERSVAYDKALSGGDLLRIFNISKPSEHNNRLISDALNKMLSIAPLGVIGTGIGLSKKKYKYID